jgi:NAD(P)-dependent dehydrogenase (short-subunit alcohol dehydrogenase family)
VEKWSNPVIGYNPGLYSFVFLLLKFCYNLTQPFCSTMASINDSKCVLVVGATSGIGRSLALSILSLPSKPTVVVAGRRMERLHELCQEHGHDGRLKCIQMDINADHPTLKTIVQDVTTEYPKVRSSESYFFLFVIITIL